MTLKEELGEALRPERLYKIDSGINLPRQQEKPHHTFPLHEMKIGDSFLASKEYDVKELELISAQCSSWAFRCKNGFKFAVRKWSGGIRVWRVE